MADWKKNADNILKGLSIVTVVVTMAGYLYFVLYYRKYNIPISQYITLSEILIHSLGTVAIILFGFLLPFGYGLFASINRKFFTQQTQVSEENKKIELIWILCSVSAYMIYMPFSDFIGKNEDQFLTWSYWLVIVFYILVNQLDDPEVQKKKFLRVLFKVIFITMFISTTLLQVSSYSKENTENTVTVLLLKDSTEIKSSNTIQYLGKTDNFYFIYNKHEKKSTIYPSSEVRQIQIIDTTHSKE